MQGAPGRLQLRATAAEIDRVVAVASVGTAATGRDETTVAQEAQVVRHEVLRLADELRQLAHRAVALHELAQESPAQGMSREPHEIGRLADPDGGRARRRHNRKLL